MPKYKYKYHFESEIGQDEGEYELRNSWIEVLVKFCYPIDAQKTIELMVDLSTTSDGYFLEFDIPRYNQHVNFLKNLIMPALQALSPNDDILVTLGGVDELDNIEPVVPILLDRGGGDYNLDYLPLDAEVQVDTIIDMFEQSIAKNEPLRSEQ
jgi:hypothetical protein